MINILKYIVLSVVIILAVACEQDDRVVDEGEFSLLRYRSKYASGFSIRTLPDSTATLIRISYADANRQQRLMILSEGQQASEKFDGVVIRDSAKRIIPLSDNYIALLDSIDKEQQVVGVSCIDSISNRVVIDGYNRGRVVEVGRSDSLDFEALTVLRPDLLLLEEGMRVESRVIDLGMPLLYIDNEDEPVSIARAEWMVLLGEICGVREAALARFRGVERSYNAWRDSIALHRDSLNIDSLEIINIQIEK